MTQKKWDDIDIGGLSMETRDDAPERSRTLRQERISCQDISTIVLEQNRTMDVAIDNLTGRKEFPGILLDISTTGAKLLASGECREPDVLRLSFRVGKRQIVCRAKVVWTRKEEKGTVAGVQFLAPNETDIDYINSLVCAKHLK